MPEYRKEWFKKAQIDYFAPFVNLWLSCNAWYMDHYSELGSIDREHINKLKTDFSTRNHLYIRFKKLIEDGGKEGSAFRANIEQLYLALSQACLINERLGDISFEKAVINYNNATDKTNLLRNPQINKDGSVAAKDVADVLLLDTVYVTSDLGILFAGIVEIIYSVRNNLIHGKMNPEENEYQVVKYCYMVLYDMMGF